MPRFSGRRPDRQFDDWTHIQTDRIVDDAIAAGHTTAPEIAAATGMSLRYAYEVLARRRPQRNLPELIRRLHTDGKKPGAIAAALGCSRQYVHRIIKR